MKGRKTDFFDWLVMGWVQSRDEAHPKAEPAAAIDLAADGTVRSINHIENAFEVAL